MKASAFQAELRIRHSSPESFSTDMKPWLRRLYSILSIGGGFTGVVLTLPAFFTQKDGGLLLYVIYACFIVLYAYGVIAGLRFAENEEDKRSLIIFYWLQVPWISSPIVGYRLASGFHISGAWIGDKLSGLFRLGSEWQFNFFQSMPWGIGVNIFALVMVLILMKKTEPNKEPLPTQVECPPSNQDQVPGAVDP